MHASIKSNSTYAICCELASGYIMFNGKSSSRRFDVDSSYSSRFSVESTANLKHLDMSRCSRLPYWPRLPICRIDHTISRINYWLQSYLTDTIVIVMTPRVFGKLHKYISGVSLIYMQLRHVAKVCRGTCGIHTLRCSYSYITDSHKTRSPQANTPDNIHQRIYTRMYNWQCMYLSKRCALHA